MGVIYRVHNLTGCLVALQSEASMRRFLKDRQRSVERVRLEIVKLLRFVTRQSIQSLVLSGKRNFTDWMETRCLDAIQFDQRELSGALEVACCMSYENGLPAPSNAELKNTNRCLYF